MPSPAANIRPSIPPPAPEPAFCKSPPAFLRPTGCNSGATSKAWASQYNLFFLLLALVPFLIFRKLKRRERVWMIGMLAVYTCMGPFLVLLLNFAPDRQSIGIAAPLFALGHVFIAMFVAYGLTIVFCVHGHPI